MDGLTHGLAGLVAGELVEPVDAQSRRRRVFWVVAAMVPDIDVLTGLGGPLWYFAYHRRVTHGVGGFLLLTVLGALCYRRLRLGSLARGACASALAIGLHIFLDVVTAFGTTVCYPLSTTDYSLDLLFIVDLAFTGLLCLTVLLHWYRGKGRRHYLYGGTVLLITYLLVAGLASHHCHRLVERAIAAEQIPAGTVVIIPQPPSVAHWAGFVVTPTGTWSCRINVFHGLEDLVFHRQPVNRQLLARANETRAAKRFLDFARLPVIEEIEGDGQVTFIYKDLRFAMSGRERANYYYASRVVVSRGGTVHSQGLANP